MNPTVIILVIIAASLNFIMGVFSGLLLEKGRHIKTLKDITTDLEKYSRMIHTMAEEYDELYEDYLEVLRKKEM